MSTGRALQLPKGGALQLPKGGVVLVALRDGTSAET